MQRRFQRGLRRVAGVSVPAPVTELAREDVLVSEWVQGVPLSRAPDVDGAARRLVQFAIGAARAGLVHADINPADVLVTDDGTLVVLDFGAAATIDRARAERLADAVEAFAAEDEAAFGRALDELGGLPATHAATAIAFVQRALGELAEPGPSRLDSNAVIAVRDRVIDSPELIGELIAVGRLVPEDLWPARGVGQLFSTVARAGATGPWLELVRDALRDGWEALA